MAITFWKNREKFLVEEADCRDGGGEICVLDGAVRRLRNKRVDFDVQK